MLYIFLSRIGLDAHTLAIEKLDQGEKVNFVEVF